MGGYGEKVAKQFAAPKLFFYTIFWGLHFFLFGYGWYAPTSKTRERVEVDTDYFTGSSRRPIPD